jgi:hypothetical protein
VMREDGSGSGRVLGRGECATAAPTKITAGRSCNVGNLG